jgi:hypothetical protein
LGELDAQVTFRVSAASRSPAFGQFAWAQPGLVFLGEGQGPPDDLDFATLASAAASAGKFHARTEQEILKRRAALDFEHLA